MAYYETASKKFIAWVESDPQRVKDWRELYGNTTVQDYLNRHSYVSDLIDELVLKMYNVQAIRTIKDINSPN